MNGLLHKLLAGFEQPQFRPPAEADSLILLVARGCPYDGCT